MKTRNFVKVLSLSIWGTACFPFSSSLFLPPKNNTFLTDYSSVQLHQLHKKKNKPRTFKGKTEFVIFFYPILKFIFTTLLPQQSKIECLLMAFWNFRFFGCRTSFRFFPSNDIFTHGSLSVVRFWNRPRHLLTTILWHYINFGGI